MPDASKYPLCPTDRLLLDGLRCLVADRPCDIPAADITPELFDAATRQGVAALLWDAVPEATQLAVDRDLRLRWAYRVHTIEKTWARQLATARRLDALFGMEGIRMAVFKGLPLSSCYPVPNHRPCGDIDCWLDGRFADGNRLIAALGIEIDYENPKHSIFRYDGVPIENHSVFLNTERVRIGPKLNDFISETIAREGLLRDENTGLLTLPPTAHALFLLRHSLHHFIEGIALRHLCDWAFFIRRYGREIDWKVLLPLIRETRMDTFFNIQNDICIEYLGLGPALLPSSGTIDPKLRDRVFADILAYGTHELTARHSLSFLVAKARRLFARRWKVRRVEHGCFALTLWYVFVDHLLRPLQRLVVKK